MAIEKMKKLRLMAVRSQKEDILRELLCLGCVEISEPDAELSSPELEGIAQRESSELLSLRSEQNAVLQALALLDRYAPHKDKLLSARPEISLEQILDGAELEAALAAAQEIISDDERIKRITAEESRLRGVLQSLAPWAELGVPLEYSGSKRCAYVLGAIPAAVPMASATAALSEAVPESELFAVSSDKDQHYTALVCFKEELPRALERLREFGFAAASLSGMQGTPAQIIAETEAQLSSLAERKEAEAAAIASFAEKRAVLRLCSDRLNARLACAEAEGNLFGVKSTVAFEGWVLARRAAELEAVLQKYDCAWELEDPTEEEYPEVPIKLRNNKLTNALNMVTNMYSLPTYDNVDPNPLMAPFFILFYGLMMADMGYGLLMVIAAIVALRKIKPKDGTLSFCQLLLYGGISTFIMGALTGGFFGDAIERVGIILGKPEGWGVLPALFSPLNDTIYVLLGAMVLGLVHLNTGMLVSFVMKLKKKDAAAAVFEEGSLWIMLVGAVFLALEKTGVYANGFGLYILILGTVMLFYGGTRGEKGFGKVTSIFATLYNTATGWLGDILSYSRIMALMLAGSVIASVFNTIGGIANSLWLFIPVFLVGHALNFALNLLGCYVHDLRLQCLEYFGKFYNDGGRAFKPLEIKTKYYDVV